jgi:hypothetical protein
LFLDFFDPTNKSEEKLSFDATFGPKNWFCIKLTLSGKNNQRFPEKG